MKLQKMIPLAKVCEPKQGAQLAKGRAMLMYEKGRLTGTAKAKIDAQANGVIGHSFHSHKGN